MATATEHHHVAVTLAEQLPALQIVIPLLAAPLVVLVGGRKAAWGIAFAACLAAFIISLMLLAQVADGSFISYRLGGWAPPLGIEYRVDALNAFMLVLISGMATIVLPYALPSVYAEVPLRHHTLFYACFLLCVTGLLGVCITGMRLTSLFSSKFRRSRPMCWWPKGLTATAGR